VSAESPSKSPLTPQKKTKKNLKNLPPGGQGGGAGSKKIYPNFYYFFLGAHAKFGNPTTTLSGRTVMAVEKKKKRKRRDRKSQ
jgi:hypothetical protein